MAALAPTQLSFPARTFQKLSPSSYLLRHLQSSGGSIRPSSRPPEAFRSPTLHTSALSHAHGSAVVRKGDTAVVCGVRGEILSLVDGDRRGKSKTVLERRGEIRTEDDEITTYCLLVPNLELGTGCSRDYHPGPPSDLAQATAERLRSLLVDTTALIPASTLRIVGDDDQIKGYWVLYVDVVCISLDGNVLDTAWASIVAALRSTRLPVARWDLDAETILCDPTPDVYHTLEMRELVFTASFCIFTNTGDDGKEERWILSDPDDFEESVCEERVMVCMQAGGQLRRIEKGGGLTTESSTVGICVKRALEQCVMWQNLILQTK